MSRVISDLQGTRSSTFGVADAVLDAASLTAPRTYELPDKSGVIALLSDIGGGGAMIESVPLTLTSVGQTVIEVPGGYADSAVLVSRNGALLNATDDFAAEDDISIELAYPVVSLDESITVYRVSAFNVANTYSQTQLNYLLSQKQAQIDDIPKTVSAKLGVAATNSTLTPAVVLSVAIPAAGLYEIVASLRFRTAATTTGIALSLLAGTGEINAMGRIAQAAAGTASFFEGSLTASATELVSTAVLAANTDYPAMVTGYYLAVGPETLSLRFRSEVNASLVTVQPNSFLSAREVK